MLQQVSWANFIFYFKKFVLKQGKKKEKNTGENGVKPSLYINSKGSLETLEEWAKRNQINLSHYQDFQVDFLRRVFD
jgi:hypothetical protein